jgi:hypothetical protein
MSALTSPHCTCPHAWRGQGKRPQCVLHEAEGHPDGVLGPGQARRRSDGTVVTVLATVAGVSAPRRDPEGMEPDVTWHPVA